jgi:hypothetical protein
MLLKKNNYGKNSNKVKVNYRFKKDKHMRVALIGSEKYESRAEIKDLVFKLLQKYGDDLILITRGNKNGVEKWVRKYALELGCKYIEYNSASTSMNLYSGMNESYYEKPFHPTQPLHQYNCIVENSDKLIYFGEIFKNEYNHFNRVLSRYGKSAKFIQ